MRYVTKIDVIAAKELTMGLVTFHPTIPEGVSSIFYVHLFFVSILLVYFPFSKLMHLGGIFLSPTRNLPADTRATRHVNPWNYPVHVHTYEEYEDEFREKMVEAGLPRITSYNVCYTKLLRPHTRGFLDFRHSRRCPF